MTLMQLAAPAAHPTIHQGFDAVVLTAGELQATFLPELGMVGASLQHRGEELLHPQAGLRAYRDRGAVTGLPFLHPWANRLGGDGYALHGRSVRLAGAPLVRRDENGLPIHGLLAAHPGWRVDSIDAGPGGARLQATLDAAADPAVLAGFPFPHLVTIAVTLTERALEVSTTVTATGDVPVPIAFGFHPYLRLPDLHRTAWEVCLPRRRRLHTDARGIPDGRTEALAPERLHLQQRSFDDGFDGVADGAAFAIAGAGRTIRLTHHRGFPVAQVYSPPAAPFICFEPMTAPVDALRSGAALPRALPGRPFGATFSIEVQEW